MFPQDAPPDTSAYMIAGYAVFFLFTAIYLFSLIVRTRNLNRDLDLLRSLEQERPQTGSPPKRKTAGSPRAGGKSARKK